jgi:hypothetical protein
MGWKLSANKLRPDRASPRPRRPPPPLARGLRRTQVCRRPRLARKHARSRLKSTPRSPCPWSGCSAAPPRCRCRREIAANRGRAARPRRESKDRCERRSRCATAARIPTQERYPTRLPRYRFRETGEIELRISLRCNVAHVDFWQSPPKLEPERSSASGLPRTANKVPMRFFSAAVGDFVEASSNGWVLARPPVFGVRS